MEIVAALLAFAVVCIAIGGLVSSGSGSSTN
jgi:hypothetical protein